MSVVGSIISLAGFCPEPTSFLNHIPALQGMDHTVHSEHSHGAGGCQCAGPTPPWERQALLLQSTPDSLFWK